MISQPEVRQLAQAKKVRREESKAATCPSFLFFFFHTNHQDNMFHLRRTALRAVASASSTPLARASRSTLPTSASATLQLKTFSTSFTRAYASENDKETSTVGDAIDSIKETVTSAATAAWDAVAPESVRSDRGGDRYDRGGDRGGDRRQREPTMEAEPSNNLYVGNLYFEVSEDTLKQEFEKYGALERVKIIYDGRGLSKGYGYVEFANQEDAAKAREGLAGQVLEGRRLAVQYSISADKKAAAFNSNPSVPKNPPSKTLFIGNMSYEMSDKDLNDLFKDVKNVLDVRVAIDRRTGQPRGFAHADFMDVASAESAAEYLKSKEFYGRNLKIDFSGQATRGPREGGRDGGRDGGRREGGYRDGGRREGGRDGGRDAGRRDGGYRGREGGSDSFE